MQPKANHRRRGPLAPATCAREAAPGNNANASLNPSQPLEHAAAVIVDASVASSTDALCPVCASHTGTVAVGVCGHIVCAACSHRLRLLYQRKTCVLCNVSNEFVVVIPASEFVAGETTASTVRDEHSRDRAPLAHEASTNMYFTDPDIKHRLQLISGFTCPTHVQSLVRNDIAAYLSNTDTAASRCNANRDAGRDIGNDDSNICRAPAHRNLGALRAHVREQHKSLFCDVCVASRSEYKSMLPIYPLDGSGHGKKSGKLVEHMKNTHPLCRFCNLHLLDDDELFGHLQKHHESCHICERSGRMHEYFRNYAALESHFQKHHFVCTDPSCRGVVFSSNIELQAHTVQRHRSDLPKNARGRRVQVDLSELHAPISSALGQTRRNGANVPTFNSDADIRREQERQAARRRGFLASRVVFLQEDGGQAGASAGPSRSLPHSSREENNSSVAAPSAANELVRVQPNAENPGHIDSVIPQAPREAPPSASHGHDDGSFHERHSPQDATEMARRNKRLIDFMRSSLDPAEFEQFRALSGDFRTGSITSEEYYDAAVASFGTRCAVRDVLPELAALLPNLELQNQLVVVCTRRNPTPPSSDQARALQCTQPSASASVGRSSHGHASNSASTISAEAFPSLPGQAVLPTRRSATRNAGFPKLSDAKNEFPSLHQVHRPQGSVDSSASYTSRRNLARAPGASQRPSAATLLMQPSPNRMFGTSSGRQCSGSASAANPVSSVVNRTRGLSDRGVTTQAEQPNFDQVPMTNEEAFPSLEANSSPSGQHDVQSGLDMTSGTQSGNIVPADVSLRVGGVWGGASRRGHGSRGKARAPGRTAPTLSSGPGSAEIKSRISKADADECPGSSTAYPPLDVHSSSLVADGAVHLSNSDVAEPGGRPNVIDVATIANNRFARNALPKVGGSGFGFAWERKKMRAKRKEVREEVKSGLSRNSSNCTSSERASGEVLPVRASKDLRCGTGENYDVGIVTSESEDVDETGAVHQNQMSTGAEDEAFDKFSYLTPKYDEGEQNDPTASFFGTG